MIKLLETASQTGKLNLSLKQLTSIPDQVFKTATTAPTKTNTIDYSFDSRDTPTWWSLVDLQKLILSDNEIKEIDERIETLVGLLVFDVLNYQTYFLRTFLYLFL